MIPFSARRPALAAFVLTLLATAAARAATYTITTLADDELDNDNCTLREALLAATSDGPQDLCPGDAGPDTIVLEAFGTYPLGGAEPILGLRSLTVRGDGDHPESDYVVDLGDARRLLEASSGATLTLENLTLTRGSSAMGGALLATDSDLTMRRVTISESQAEDGGGVAFTAPGARTLDLSECTFLNNAGIAYQIRGGGLYVDLQNGGLATIAATSFLGNRLQDTSDGSYSRQGGGLYVQGYGSSSLVLRHLRFEDNWIDAPSFAGGAGAYLYLSGSGSFLLEDAKFDGNEFIGAPIAASAVALSVDVTGDSATLRRLRMTSNLAAASVDQAVVQIFGTTQGVVSDLLVADGMGGGLFLATSGDSCALVAGNLTVARNAGAGLSMFEGCPLRIENSIVDGNSPNTNVFGGAPEISAETLVGVDPLFVDAPNGDYRLAPLSPALNAGDGTFLSVGPFDAAHGTRIVGADVDLGALERGAIFADDFERGDRYAWSSFLP